jgi:hypothetical protein
MSTVTMPASGGWGEVPNEDLRVGLASVGRDPEYLRSHILGDVRLTAVLADLRRYLVDDDRQTLAVERRRRRPRLGLSVMADDAIHRLFLRVLKSGSHSTGSGRYAASTMISSSSMLSRTATWRAPSLHRPSTKRAG